MYLESGHWLSLCHVPTIKYENFDSATSGTEISWKRFLENLKIVEVQKSKIIQPKIPGGKSNGTEIYSKIFPEIPENFVYSSLEIQPSIFYRIESAQFVTCFHMLKFHDSEKNCRTRKGHYDITLTLK